MSAFNSVIVPWKSSITSKEYKLKVQFKYGDVWQSVYQIGETLRWGGNDIGHPRTRRVVVDGCLEGEPAIPDIPEDFEIYIVENKIDRVIPATGDYNFVDADDTFIVLEE
ncbi:hypothetical protein AB3N59_06840 [Leptospira sp. WS92.C1]